LKAITQRTTKKEYTEEHKEKLLTPNGLTLI